MSNLIKALDEFFSAYKLRTYHKGDIIFHEDDTPSGAYYLKSGFIRLYALSSDGEEVTRKIIGPKYLFPLRWVLNSEPIDFYAEPMTDVEAWHAPRDIFMKFITSQPDLLLELTKDLAYQLGLVYKRLGDITFGTSSHKTAAALLSLAKEFGEKHDENIIIQVPFTHQDLASLVGLRRETISLEIVTLEKKNIIDDQPRLTVIKKPNELEKIALGI